MSQTYEPLIEDSVEIDAPPAAVWALVSDLTRMGDWSPQVDSTRWRGDATAPAVGVQFTSRNSHGELVWKTTGEVVRLVPEQEIAFRIEENWVVWSFHLEPTETGGTRLSQRREVPEGLSQTSVELTDGFMGGQDAFTAQLRAGMRQTLEGIRASAES
ncbi:SRPBCC family protein [Nocardioides sp. Y6]|uniref:SRPBCC family protein n=1 Tax=Nocardioides malaquae TaxID=2773426 RepID=A0ABR9RRG4_9ACTN|nr:SRPBCC family protein [Nocardioides malaquae]MBE7324162.1 SRPBCC family protein [Nocardioides malaquae]